MNAPNMTSDQALRLDAQLCFAFHRASRAMVRAYGPVLAPLGLTYPQYVVMLVLWERDGVSVKALAERLSLDSATLTPLLKRLEVAGFLLRRRDPSDERVLVVTLSRAGKLLQAKARQVPARVACAAGFDLARGEEAERLAALRLALQQLADGLLQGEAH